MRFYRLPNGGYAKSIVRLNGCIEISEEEYNASVPPTEPEPPTDEEALTRYANALTGANDPDLISAAETLIEQRIKETAE